MNNEWETNRKQSREYRAEQKETQEQAVEVEKIEHPKSQIGVVTAMNLNVREKPHTSAKVVKTLRVETEVEITTKTNGWGRVEAENGWVMLEHIAFK